MRKLTTSQEERLFGILGRLYSDDQAWFSEHNIQIGNKNPYWILNYLPGPRNEFNSLCRGLVIKQSMIRPKTESELFALIDSFPFTRFYNYGEPEAAKIDLGNADMLEKLDGTMVSVFFPKACENVIGVEKKPRWHTRRLISTNCADMELTTTGFHGGKFKLMQLIGDYVQSLNFHKLDVKYTFVFEFIHDASFVLTKYTRDEWGLYLIGARNTHTFEECTENQLDKIAPRIGAKRPKRFDSRDDFEYIDKMMRKACAEQPDFEGFVFRDRDTFERIKIKDPEYVEHHHLIGSLSYKNLIKLVLKGESDEIIAYFPLASEKIDKIADAFGAFVHKAVREVQKWRMKNLDRKTMALRIFKDKEIEDKYLAGIVMQNYEIEDDAKVGENITAALRRICLGHGRNDGSPKRLIEILGLEDDALENMSEV